MFRTDLTTQHDVVDREALRHAEHLAALAHSDRGPASDAQITVRALHEDDAAGLGHLAGRDSSTVPGGRLIGAEVDGSLVAALSLADGGVLADPFRSTTAAVELLRLRARQLHSPRRRRLPRMPRRSSRPPRGRGSLAGSPPGAAGNLLQL